MSRFLSEHTTPLEATLVTRATSGAAAATLLALRMKRLAVLCLRALVVHRCGVSCVGVPEGPGRAQVWG